MKTNIKNLSLLPALLFVLARASGEVLVGGGGGPASQPKLDCIPQAQPLVFGVSPVLIGSQPKLDCIPQAQRDAVEAAIAANPVTPRGPHPPDGGPAPYPFQAIAGTVWQDRFIFNFVDLDPSSGILDWDCTGFTYNGHSEPDLNLRHFGQQDVGVPVFAALDGTVIARHDGEFDRNNSLNPSAVANYVVLDH